MIVEIEFATPAYDEMVCLRDRILRKPLGLEFTPEEISEEYADYHLAYYVESGEMKGCLVLKPLNETQIQMLQVAVDENLQKQGIGTQLVLASEKLAKELGFTEIILHARDNAIAFYKRLNYEQIGEGFVEVNIPHMKMRKILSVES